ncbi:serine/threonine-protein kinase [Streptomyces nodosus]|uniref:non-specific serine/threonine protein kinase n=1 Tax=Streptomyces nodosus TaxID=40318 RepID=A0A0B5DLQ5_9ACTN|nr:serine/threonine-protein kinase [Streptomyces nodosus]AJE42080.1 serine/threonine protein kinase [Streptomyces nodosus]MBB4793336.1 serine/threonine protein kinase [Streptomyces nodosus]QEV40602.1 serine/threonine protein kinase [Streptomyces nodosus]
MQGLLLAGRYRLVESIGSGGMGRVWRAHDQILHRDVAIKELTAALYAMESDRAVLLARTHAEARAAARINHSAVVTVHDVLEHDNRPWIVMELVEGNSLADAVKERGRLDAAEAAGIGLWVTRALRAAHAAGVLHRDVKPGNVLLAADGRVLLTDFGIAQVEGDTTITRTGEIVGSVDYLAPERVRGHDPGPASDLWALGATLYTAVEGRSPFRRTSPLTTMQAVVDDEPAVPQFGGALEPVIAALLHKDPAQRPGAEQLEQMLAEAAEGRRPKAAQEHVATLRMDLGGEEDRTPTVAHPGEAPDPQASGGTQPQPAPSAAPWGRRNGRKIALVLAMAAVVGAGGAVAANRFENRDTGTGTSASTSPPDGSTSPSDASTPQSDASTPAPRKTANSIPDGWVRTEDPAGFTLALPDEGWKREPFGAFQTDYTPDGGKHFIRIALDTAPDFDDAYAHQVDLEQQLQRLVDYERVTLQNNVYRDCPGSLWEYTWTALAKDTPFPGPRHAVEEMYTARDGTEYAIYMSGPADDWSVTREQFDVLLRAWRPPAA